MAEKKKADVVATEEAAAEVFDAKEIAENSPTLFGYSTDIAAAALEIAKIERCTLNEAAKTIKAFAERKVE